MSYMFYAATNFDQDISDWNVSSVATFATMFDGATSLSDDNKCNIHNTFDSNDLNNEDEGVWQLARHSLLFDRELNGHGCAVGFGLPLSKKPCFASVQCC